MLVTITFNTDEDGAVLLAAYAQHLRDNPKQAKAKTGAEAALTPVARELGKMERKARADAGKPRGKYNKTSAGPDTAPVEAIAIVETPLALAAATVAEKETVEVKMPTLDNARAALKRLNDTAGHGMQACLDALTRHGVKRVSDLKPEQHGKFVEYVEELLKGGAA